MLKYWTEKEDKFLKINYNSLSNNDIALRLDRSWTAICSRASKLKLKSPKEKRYRNHFNKDDVSHFVNIKTPEVAYFLGFLWADGWLTRHTAQKKKYSLAFKIIYKDYISIQKIIKPLLNWGKYIRKPPSRQKTCQLHFTNKQLYDFLIKNDYLIKSQASADKILNKISQNLKKYWFRGFFDGDGHFHYIPQKEYCICISGDYKQNWRFIKRLCHKLKISKYKIYRKIRE